MNSDFCVATHALVYLKHKARILSSEELADNICTNPARVRKVLARLRDAGLVSTREGADGGYFLRPEAGETTLAQIALALGPDFVDIKWRSGSVDKDCLVSSGMGGVMDEVIGELNEACLSLLSRKTISQIEAHLFGNISNGVEQNAQL